MAKSAATPSPDPLLIKLVPIDSLHPDPANAREHNDRSIVTMMESLKRWGQRKPIVVTAADNIIRAGNGTWLAAKRLGWQKINVTLTDLPPAEAALYGVADNRTGELSYFDDTALAAQLAGAQSSDLVALGFDQAELSELLDAAGDAGPAPEPTPSKPGQNMGGKASVRALITVENVGLFERAMGATGKANREQALLELCRAYLNASGDFETD